MTDMFLSQAELTTLTGRKTKSKQIEALRKMSVVFFVNAAGRPVVAKSAIEGQKEVHRPLGWQPSVLGS